MSLDPDLIPAKNAQAYAGAWVWLLEVYVNAAEILRLTTNETTVTFRSVDWVPAPGLKVGALSQDNTGQPGSREVVISNLDRRLGKLILAERSMAGRQVTMMEVQTAHLDNPDAVASENVFKVRAASVTRSEARFTLSLEDLSAKPFPFGRLHRGCRFKFGGSQCGYDKTVGALKTCSQTLQGGNGCEAHGTEEAGRGAEILHPRRFGGGPCLPRRY